MNKHMGIYQHPQESGFYAERHARWRSMLYPAQDGMCPICGRPLLTGGPLSIDHVLAKSRGGADDLGNVLLTHWKCNNDKGHALPTGCTLVWLLSVNNRLGVQPTIW